ncbi:hypothetical protein [Chryseobacterium sp. M5A1_1a]
MKQNYLLFALCIFVNLLIGNIVLLIIFTDMSFIYNTLISLFIILIYSIAFYKLDLAHKQYGRWKQIGIAIGLSLSALLTACIFSSIGNRLPMDGIITAGFKGIIPMFIFAVVLASPFWLFLALFNFLCLYLMKRQKI